jgi:hypothetical protein
MNLYRYYNRPKELMGWEFRQEIPAIVVNKLVKGNTASQVDPTLDRVDQINRLSPQVLRGIAENAELSYLFARFGIKGPWKPGEAAIAQDPTFAYKYAANVLYKRFPQGEKAIATDPINSFDYAASVIHGPWPAGEKAIAQDPYMSLWYARSVIQGPWPPGEPAISSNPDTAHQYEKYKEYKDSPGIEL